MLDYLRNITFLIEMIPFVFYSIFFNKNNVKGKGYFFAYTLLLFFGICVVNYFFVHQIIQGVKITLRVYVVGEFALISLVFYKNFVRPVFKLISLTAILPFTAYVIYDYFPYSPASVTFGIMIIEGAVFLIYIMCYFYEILRSDIVLSLFITPFFWILIAFFIFFSGNFFLYLFRIHFNKTPLLQKYYTLINSTITILKDIFLCVAIAIKEPPTVSNNLAAEENNLAPHLFYSSNKI